MSMALRALTLALLLALPLLGGAEANHTTAEPGILYLRPDAAGGRNHNFTTYAPTGDGAALPMLGALERSQIGWSTASVPDTWTVPVDATVRLEVWIEGLGRVVPLTDPAAASDAPGQVLVQARLRHGDDVGTPFASGETAIPASPTASGAQKVEVTLTVDRSVTFTNDTGTGASFLLDVVVPGYTRQDEPLNVHVLAAETPSKLLMETFPVDAFRAWEERERMQAACHDQVVAGAACEEPSPTTTRDPPGRDSSAASWVLIVAALLVGITVTRRSRRG